MRSRQTGITILGLLVALVLVGGWVYVGIRLVPVYLESMAIQSALNKVRDEFESNPGTNEQLLRTAVSRQFDVETIDVINFRDVQITRDGGTFTIRAAYEDVVPLVANVYLLADFDHSVEVAAR